jgi:hypothetical protein
VIKSFLWLQKHELGRIQKRKALSMPQTATYTIPRQEMIGENLTYPYRAASIETDRPMLCKIGSLGQQQGRISKNLTAE